MEFHARGISGSLRLQLHTTKVWASAVFVGAALAGGCSSEPPNPSRDSTTVTAKRDDSPWYERTRATDVTSDGKPDTVRLVAMGSDHDSLRVILSIHVQGRERHREEWGSSYELAMIDSITRMSSSDSSLLRAKLDSVLESVVVQPFDAPGVRLMAEDSVTLSAISPRPTHRVSFSYGYETTVHLAWDAPRGRFIRLWSCC